jgi:hypothetical protein
VGSVIVLALRLTLPLTVVRWHLAGAIIAIVADAVDVLIYQLTSFPELGYHRVDKLLDLYTMSLLLGVSLQWGRGVALMSSALFTFRVVGVLLFELSGHRLILMGFPNVFEFFYLFNAARLHYVPEYEMTPTRSLGWLLALTSAKLAQEYVLHSARWLDQWSAGDILRSLLRELIPWRP